MPAHYALNYAGIFDGGLHVTLYWEQLTRIQVLAKSQKLAHK